MPYYLREDCPRCKGAGKYETIGDLHKSAGVVPCDHWFSSSKLPRSYQQAVRAMTGDMLLVGTENSRLRAQLAAALERVAELEQQRHDNGAVIYLAPTPDDVRAVMEHNNMLVARNAALEAVVRECDGALEAVIKGHTSDFGPIGYHEIKQARAARASVAAVGGGE